MYVLFTDTDCNISPEEGAKLNLNVINMTYSIGEVEHNPYDNFDCHEYYQKLRSGVIPKTASVSLDEYLTYFEPFLKEGKDILYVHFSEKMSGTFNALKNAIDELKERYPERHINTVSTKAIAPGALILVKQAAKMYNENASEEEIINYIESEREHYATLIVAEDLRFFAKSGRASNFSGAFGTILGIRVLLNISSDGSLPVFGKAFGRDLALNTVIKKVKEIEDHIADYEIILTHSDNMQAVEQLSSRLKKEFGEALNISVVALNPTIGAHCGPSAWCISFHSKQRF